MGAVRGFSEALSAVRTGGEGEGAQLTALGAALDRYVDFDRISLRVLGPYWTAAAPDHRTQMGLAIRDYLAKRLSGFIAGKPGTPISVASAFETPWGADSLVSADIAFSPGSSKSLAFLLSGGETPRIYDVIVSGISAVELLSAECQSIMRRDGATALLVRLNQ